PTGSAIEGLSRKNPRSDSLRICSDDRPGHCARNLTEKPAKHTKKSASFAVVFPSLTWASRQAGDAPRKFTPTYASFSDSRWAFRPKYRPSASCNLQRSSRITHWDHELWKAPASRTQPTRSAQFQERRPRAAAFGVRGARSRFWTRLMGRGCVSNEQRQKIPS